MPFRVSKANAERVRRLMALVDQLPEGEASRVRARVVEKLKSGPVVIGADAPAAPRYDDEGQPVYEYREWDLALANWLDSVYGTVAEKVEQVAEKGLSATKAVARETTSTLTPLLIAAAAVLLAWSYSKRR